MKMRKKNAAKRAGVVVALAVGPLLLTASPAFAVQVNEGSDYAYNSDNFVYACDREEDGNGVYAEYWGSVHGQVWDQNGSASGCGGPAFVSGLSKFRVCEDDLGDDTCSSIVTL